jgi:hypothetical protein
MKKINLFTKTLTLGWFMVISTSLLAVEPAPRSSSATAQKAIRDYFRFPRLVSPLPVGDTEKVEVFFTTGHDGKVNFVMARTGNQALRDLVERKMAGMRVALQPDVVHSVVLSFRKE